MCQITSCLSLLHGLTIFSLSSTIYHLDNCVTICAILCALRIFQCAEHLPGKSQFWIKKILLLDNPCLAPTIVLISLEGKSIDYSSTQR